MLHIGTFNRARYHLQFMSGISVPRQACLFLHAIKMSIKMSDCASLIDGVKQMNCFCTPFFRSLLSHNPVVQRLLDDTTHWAQATKTCSIFWGWEKAGSQSFFGGEREYLGHTGEWGVFGRPTMSQGFVFGWGFP